MPDTATSTIIITAIKDFGAVTSLIVMPVAALIYFKYVKSPLDEVNKETAAIREIVETNAKNQSEISKKMSDQIDKINSNRLEESVRDEETRKGHDKLELKVDANDKIMSDIRLDVREIQTLLKRKDK